MQFIPENDMAFDTAQLGFPSIMGCQAICIETSRGLYGFHDMKSAAKPGLTAAEAGASKLQHFVNWVHNQMIVGETVVSVNGVINRSEQYSADSAGNGTWQAVLMSLVGDPLNFDGPVRGHRLNNSRHLKTGESAYVQFDLVGGSLSVGYKRMTKMKQDHANKETVNPADHQRVVYRNGAFQTEDAYKNRVTPIVRDHATKGANLNAIARSQFITFQ